MVEQVCWLLASCTQGRKTGSTVLIGDGRGLPKGWGRGVDPGTVGAGANFVSGHVKVQESGHRKCQALRL